MRQVHREVLTMTMTVRSELTGIRSGVTAITRNRTATTSASSLHQGLWVHTFLRRLNAKRKWTRQVQSLHLVWWT